MKLIFFLFGFCMLTGIFGQRPLRIGDQVPDLLFRQTINHGGKPLRLSELRGRIVILDLWSIYCGSCVSAFPRMDSMQRVFKDSVRVILANPYPETRAQIQQLLDRRQQLTGHKVVLPIVYGAQELEKYFPHVSVPHEVWIDASGKVIGISFAEDVTVNNLRAALAGRLRVAEKNDFAFDRKKPLSGDTAGNLFSARLTRYQPGISPHTGTRTNGKGLVSGYFILNQNLRMLLQAAYPKELGKAPDNIVVVETADPQLLQRNAPKEALFCYDVNFPARSRNGLNVGNFLREDLRRAFGLRVEQQQRMRRCWVIKRGSAKTSAYPKADIAIEPVYLKQYFHGVSSGEIIGMLNHYSDAVLIDESGVGFITDLDFPQHAVLSDFKVILGALRAAGFDVSEEEREIQVVVITDR